MAKKWLQDTADFARNAGLAYADTYLSAVGADNAIGNDMYKGSSANDFRKISTVTGGVAKAALPIAAGATGMALGGPQGAQLGMAAGKGVQMVGGQMNPGYQAQGNDVDNTYYKTQQAQQFAAPIQNIAMMGMGTGMSGQIPMMRNGGIQYAKGGMINAEVEKNENTLNPDGSTYQFNGPSHENGGIKTYLDNTTKIFSDKLKPQGSKLTFADLNKPNMTTKEEKLLKDTRSSSLTKSTAQLMKDIKNENSEKLFQEQESLKEQKYRSQLERDLFSCGGMIKYKDGGIHIKPENRGKFTAAAKRAGMGVQEYANHILAHKKNYSSTLVKRANFAHNAAGWKHEDGGVQQFPNGGEQWFVPKTDLATLNKSTANSLGFNYKSGNWSNPSSLMFNKNGVDYSYTTDKEGNAIYVPQIPKASSFTTKSTGIAKQEPNWIPMGTLPNSTEGYFMKGNTTGTDRDKRYTFKNGEYVEYHRDGGIQKYPEGGLNSINPGLLPTNNIEPELKGNTSLDLSNINAFNSGDMYNAQPSNNPNWGNIAQQGLLALGQNMGNIYDLKRAQTVDQTNYERAKANLLNSSADLATNNRMYSDAKKMAKEGSTGNSSTYLQMAAMARQNKRDMDLDTNMRYNNANAQILNQTSMFNAQTQAREMDANQANQAQARNLKSNAYSNIGQNIMGQYKDNKMANVDKQRIDILSKYYNDPTFQKMIEQYKKSNNIG